MGLEQTSRPRPWIASTLVYSVLLTAILYLLLSHLAASAPIRSGGRRPPSLERALDLQVKTAKDLDRASAGKNVQLHFQLSAQEWASNSFFFSTIYFRAAYAMYPRRVYVGWDNRVVNYPDDLKSADVLPTPQWLRQHDVPAVLSFAPADDRGPAEMVYRVP